MSAFPVLALFAFAAVLNSAILGTSLIWRGRDTHLKWLGWMFFCVGYLLAVYALEHYHLVLIGGWLRLSFDLVSIVLSCFLLEYIFGGLLKRRPPLVIYGSLLLYIIALTVFRGGFLGWLTIGRLVILQSFYTLAAMILCIRDEETPWKTRHWNRTWLHCFSITVAFLVIHAAHLLRMLLGGGTDHDIAPIIGIAVLIGLTFFALTGARMSSWASPRPRMNRTDSRDLLRKLDAAMRDRRLFSLQNLDLATLAREVESTPQNVSAALNTELGKSFYEYVTIFRIQEAERLLVHPERTHHSLEAIGAESGFKSRSSFYNSFKNATGVTPGDYRKAKTS